AIANRLLRRHGRVIGIQPSFTLLDRADTADLLALVRDELTPPRDRAGSSDHARARRRARKETLADILSRCTNTRTPLSAMLRAHYPWCAEERAEMREAFEAYTARKRAQSVLDYDDLLLCWDALLEAPAVALLL